MATTTAFTACGAVVKLEDGATTLRDVSGSSNSVEFNFDNKIGEFRTFDTQWFTRVQCGKDAGITLKGVATTAANEIKEIVESWFFSGSGDREFTFAYPSEATGSKRITANVFLKNFSFSADPSDANPMMYSIELTPTGEVTQATIS